MRLPFSAAPWAGLVSLSAGLLLRCGSSQTEVPVGPGLDAGTLVPPDAEFVVFDAPPDSTTCDDDAGACLQGMAVPGSFVHPPAELRATLYEGFPVDVGFGIASQKVALDTTWAFEGFEAGAHYFVQFDPGYSGERTAAEQAGIPTVVGPFVVPGDAGASVSVQANPADITVFEQGLVGAPMQIESVFARVDEATAGGSNVSIGLGDAGVPLPFDATQSGYLLQLASPLAAQPTYTVTVASGLPDASSPSRGHWPRALRPAPAPSRRRRLERWCPPTRISPSSGPQVEEADYVSVALFAESDAGFAQAFSAPSVPLDTTIVTVPAMNLPPGSYLLDVGFVRAFCPPERDGCVHSSRVVSEPLTAQ